MGIKGGHILLAHAVGFLGLAVALHPLLLVQESLRPVVIILGVLKILERRVPCRIISLSQSLCLEEHNT